MHHGYGISAPRPRDRRQAFAFGVNLKTCNQSQVSHVYDWWPLMLPTSPFAQALRNAAPKLSPRFFDYHHCQTITVHLAKTSRRKASSPIRSKSHLAWNSRRSASTLVSSDRVQSLRAQPKQKSSFPDTSSNSVAYWLLGSAASVFGIVVFGGWTRLTESG